MEDTLVGFLDVSDSDRDDPNSIDVTIGGTEPNDSPNNDFVDEQPEEITGTVTEGDPTDPIPVPGVVITVVEDPTDPTADPIATTLMNSDGIFTFVVSPRNVTFVVKVHDGFHSVSGSDTGTPDNNGDGIGFFTIDTKDDPIPLVTFLLAEESCAPSLSHLGSFRYSHRMHRQR